MNRNRRPSAQEVAKRLIILRCVVVYAMGTPPRELVKTLLQASGEVQRTKFVNEMEMRRDAFQGRMEALDLWNDMSPREREYAQATAVTMTDRQQTDALWRVEAAQVLMWDLKLLPDLPLYGTQADGEILKAVPSEDAAGFIESARLRADDEIEAARSLAELWHWRSRTRQLIEEGDKLNADPKLRAAGFNSYDDIVSFTAKQARKEGKLQSIVHDDFGVNGKAYRDLKPDEWSYVRSMTMERHFALNWLCAYAPGNRWDETPTAT
ncbi:MAG: DUF4272 domain-containing protein [Chloroflexi bacterium]|nr:DUF4272 domain-containing protein [Chloroflexota bacterium]